MFLFSFFVLGKGDDGVMERLVRWDVRKVMCFMIKPHFREERSKVSMLIEEKLSHPWRSPDVASIVMRLTRCQTLSFVSFHVRVSLLLSLHSWRTFIFFLGPSIIVIVAVVVNSGPPRAF